MSKMIAKDRLVKDAEACALLSRTRTSLFYKIKAGHLPRKVTIRGIARSSGFLYNELMPYLDPDFEPEQVPYFKRVCLTEVAGIFSVTLSTISRWVKWGIFPKPNNKCGVWGWAYGDVMKVLHGEYVSAKEKGSVTNDIPPKPSAGGYKLVPLYDALLAICAAEQSLEKERSQKMAGKAV